MTRMRMKKAQKTSHTHTGVVTMCVRMKQREGSLFSDQLRN